MPWTIYQSQQEKILTSCHVDIITLPAGGSKESPANDTIIEIIAESIYGREYYLSTINDISIYLLFGDNATWTNQLTKTNMIIETVGMTYYSSPATSQMKVGAWASTETTLNITLFE